MFGFQIVAGLPNARLTIVGEGESRGEEAEIARGRTCMAWVDWSIDRATSVGGCLDDLRVFFV
jgi:hypothetical protein